MRLIGHYTRYDTHVFINDRNNNATVVKIGRCCAIVTVRVINCASSLDNHGYIRNIDFSTSSVSRAILGILPKGKKIEITTIPKCMSILTWSFY